MLSIPAAADQRINARSDRIKIRHTVDRLKQPPIAVVRKDGHRSIPVYRQPLSQSFFRIVRPALSRCRQFVCPSQNSCDQRLFLYLELDNMVELEAFVCKHRIKRLRLRDGSRETVENKTVLAIRFANSFSNDFYDHLVRHEIPFIHKFFCALPDFASRDRCGPQNFAGGQRL